MKSSKCHIFDLENSLVNIDRKVWIINKKSPSEPIIKISESDYRMIDSGIFRNQDNLIKFNGKKYYISDDILKRLEKVNKNIELEDLGISMREYIDKELIDKLDFDILTNNIIYLRNKEENFYIISSRLIESKYTKLTKKLEEELIENGIKVEKVYFINETFNNQEDDIINYKKSIILLQHIFGLRIEDDRFVPISCDRYNDVYYYDASESTINELYNINSIFEFIYRNTENTSVKNVIDTLLGKLNLRIYLNLVTTNEVNRFNTKIVNIKLSSINESIIKRFNQFK